MKKFYEEYLGYSIMFMLIIAQCVVGEWFLLGQVIYLISNIANVVRDFALARPIADKVKNILFSAITLGLILIKVL